MAAAGRRVPLQVQVTLQESGTMLLGTEINAALAILDVYDIDIVGLNCATGPREMNDAVRYLCHNTSKQISVLPMPACRTTRVGAVYTNSRRRN